MKLILLFTISAVGFAQIPIAGGGGPGGGSGGGITSVGSGCGMSGGPITTSGTLKAAEAVRAATGTTDTILSADCGKLVTESNAGAVAVTLPQATGSFGALYFFDIVNLGVGTATITPTTSTINGAATLALTTGQGAHIVSDGTNYTAVLGQGSSGGGAPSGPAGGDLSGTYPNPTVAKLNGAPASTGLSADNTIGIANGTTIQPKTLPDCTDTGGNHLNYTDSTNVVSCGTSGGNPTGAAGGDLSGTYPNPTVAKVNGAPASTGLSADNTVPVGNGTTMQPKTVPNCTDTAGNHLNYTDSTNTFSCGTSGGSSGITQLTGDATAGPGSGSQAVAVVKVNGGSVPASQGCVGTNGSSQFIAGTCSGTPFTVMSVTKTSGPVLTIGAECTTSNYCNVGIGSKSYQFSTSATATITAGTGTAFIYVSSAGVLTVASNVTVTCSSCTAVVGTSFPDGSKPLYRWTATSSTVWDTFDPSFDFRAYLSTSYITPLTGGLVTYTNGVASVGPDQIVVAFKYFTTAAPGSIAGNLPGDLAVDTTNHNAYVCNAPSGTAAPACTSVTTAGWLLLNGGGGSSAFSSLTSGTNTGAAMVVGSGASIAVSGSGTNAATSAPVSGLTGAGTGVLTALAANVSGTGAICLASGSACGSGSSPAFSALTSATNTTAAMVVGTGASLAASGSGTIAATAAPIAGLTGAGTGVLTALAANVSGTGAICLASGSACAGGGGTPGGSTTQCQYNNAGSFAGNAGCTTNGTVYTLTNPSLTGTVTNTQGTLAGSSTPAYTHTVTFNNAATAFNDDFRNITNTASDQGSNFVKWQVNGSDRFTVNLAGEIQTYGGGVTAANFYIDPGGVIRGRDSMGDATTIYFPAAGKLLLSNYVQSDFSMLQFGTTTSADPALKMNGTTIEAKLADDSAYTTFTALQVQSKVTTVGALGTCNSGAEGTRRGVTDALVPVALATVAGGGSVHVGVYCDGTNWIVQ